MIEEQIQNINNGMLQRFPIGKEFTVLLKIEESESILELMNMLYGNIHIAGSSIQRIDFDDKSRTTSEEELFDQLAIERGYIKKENL